MIAAFGAEVGNASLKFIPTGGMYVTGGLTPKNIHLIEGADSAFIKAYLDKGPLDFLLDTVPLFAVMTEDIGLRGARVCAERVRVFSLYCMTCLSSILEFFHCCFLFVGA